MTTPKVSRCKHCSKVLATNEHAWASRDGMFCTFECGVLDAMALYDESEYSSEEEHRDKAERYFKDVAEEISREDYGAEDVVEAIYTCPSVDITVIMHHIYEGNEHIQTTLTGWYYGEPEPGATASFDNGSMTATFVE